MSEFKLKTKQDIERQKTSERSKEVQEGVKLAKSIDLLRETYSQEQVKLKLFRDSSLKLIKDQIDNLENEKKSLDSEVKKLKDERIIAQAPIDLVQEWKKVRKDRREIDIVKNDLLNRETQVIGRELGVETSKKEIFEREEKLKEIEETSNNYLIQTGKNYEVSEKMKIDTEQYKLDTIKTLEDRERKLDSKEQELKYRESDLTLEKQSIIQQKIDIEKEKIHIESQQQSLKVAWDGIRKLQNN